MALAEAFQRLEAALQAQSDQALQQYTALQELKVAIPASTQLKDLGDRIVRKLTQALQGGLSEPVRGRGCRGCTSALRGAAPDSCGSLRTLRAALASARVHAPRLPDHPPAHSKPPPRPCCVAPRGCSARVVPMC